MDLEEYRRVYMNAEGIGNTPLRMGQRAARFVKALSAFPRAFTEDAKERQERAEVRKLARKEIQEHGLNIESIGMWISGRPRLHNHVYETSKKSMQAGLRAGLSVNELGQTSAAITGGKRSDTYNGQDLENGIRFAIRGASITGKAIQLPSELLHQAEDLVVNRGIIPNYLHMPGEVEKTANIGKETRQKAKNMAKDALER